MKRILSIICAAMMSIVAMATVVVVDGVHVRMRWSPSTSGEIVTNPNGTPIYPAKGTTFPYLGTSGNFYKINYKGNTVFISRDFCHIKEGSTPTSSTKKTTVVVVDGQNVRFRHTPSTQGAIVLNEEGQTLYPRKGQELTYLGTSGNFYKIDWYGEVYYISRDYTHLKTK